MARPDRNFEKSMLVRRDMLESCMSKMAVGVLMHQALPLSRCLHRRVDQRVCQEQHLDLVGVASGGSGAPTDIGPIGLHRLDAAGIGYDRVGPARGEFLPALRAAFARSADVPPASEARSAGRDSGKGLALEIYRILGFSVF